MTIGAVTLADTPSTSKYICKCGYDAGNRKNRLTTHQNQFCKEHKRSVPCNQRCPICGIENTYFAIKSHLAQIAREGRKNNTRDARHKISIQDHLNTLVAFKKPLWAKGVIQSR